MTPGPEVLAVGAPVAEVLKLMSIGFRHIPVVDAEYRPACVVAARDIVEFLVEAFPREVLNLPMSDVSPGAREGA
ncbi:MAG: CBS domain-containing protein [Deltaproteobacteria bacterium]|nr:CBS domain-containing protein [Deltaproteobacteria bacterium]